MRSAAMSNAGHALREIVSPVVSRFEKIRSPWLVLLLGSAARACAIASA
jgi:hypothetical protein